MSKKPYRTEKQRRVMRLIIDGVDKGVFYTLTTLNVMLGPDAVYGTTRKCVRNLLTAGMLVQEQAGRFKHLKLTVRGNDWFRR